MVCPAAPFVSSFATPAGHGKSHFTTTTSRSSSHALYASGIISEPIDTDNTGGKDNGPATGTGVGTGAGVGTEAGGSGHVTWTLASALQADHTAWYFTPSPNVCICWKRFPELPAKLGAHTVVRILGGLPSAVQWPDAVFPFVLIWATPAGHVKTHLIKIVSRPSHAL